jgi:hypothetical protein
VAIFDSRPGFPLVAAPFVMVFGAWRGAAVATALTAVLGGVLAYSAVRLASGRPLAGVFAAALLFVLPSGFWLTRLLADGMVMTGYLGVLLGITLMWVNRPWSGLSFLAAALLWTFGAKPANGTVLAAALAGIGVVGLLIPRFRRQSAAVAGLGVLGLAFWTIAAIALGLPGLNETLQDLATAHYARPDVPDPVSFMVRQDAAVAMRLASDAVHSPWPLALVVLGSVVLIVHWRMLGLVWVAAGLSGLVVVLVHPMISQVDRLVTPLWVPVAGGLGLASALAVDRGRSRRGSQPDAVSWSGTIPGVWRFSAVGDEPFPVRDDPVGQPVR